VDASDGDVLYAKNPGTTTPIASLTKLMTALVVIDAHLPMDEPVTVTQEDVDTLRNSNSRLPVGWVLSRWDLLHLAVMASENRAAFALARTYPGGREACVAAMNRKARFLGMRDSAFYDPTGLDGRNVSTALDVARLVRAAAGYETVRRLSTSPDFRARSLASGRSRLFGNTNALIHRSDWDILVTKTGFINEAGYCLAMEADVEGRPLIFVILDGRGKASRLADAERLAHRIEVDAGAAVVGDQQ
jgi:D-alanyl-D-alanine endopeptidase (penicillin-binding protein 7)